MKNLMSTMYFHSITEDAKVSGAERTYAGVLCHQMVKMALGIGTFAESGLYRQLLPPDAYPLQSRDGRAFFEALDTYLFAGFGEARLRMPGTGEPINAFHAALNTAVVAGSDAIRLLAKLHAQCKIHCYVEGEHRAWLADVIEQGVKDNILRTKGGLASDEYGWQRVIALLRRADDNPIVTSYSVTEQFPNSSTARTVWHPSFSNDEVRHHYELPAEEDVEEWRDDYRSELWGNLPDERQWELAMQALRQQDAEGHLQITPDTLSTQGYGNGISGFDIYAALSDTNKAS